MMEEMEFSQGGKKGEKGGDEGEMNVVVMN